MAVKAYVLITVDTAVTQQVVEKIRKIKGIKEVSEVLGPYDIVVEMETDRLDEVTDVLRTEIRRIHGVRNTITCVTMR